jgi:hypothetical protein
MLKETKHLKALISLSMLNGMMIAGTLVTSLMSALGHIMRLSKYHLNQKVLCNSLRWMNIIKYLSAQVNAKTAVTLAGLLFMTLLMAQV